MMLNLEKRNEIICSFKDLAKENFDLNCHDLEMEKFMESNNGILVRESIEKIKNNVLAAIPEGYAIPKVSLYCSYQGENSINIISIIARNAVNDSSEFKFKFIVTSVSVKSRIRDFFIDVYAELLENALVKENLYHVNNILELAATKAELPYKVTITSPMGNEGKKIAMLSDDEVVFVADPERVFELDDIMVLQEENEIITEEMLVDALEHEVKELIEAQTPEQLVAKHGGALCCYVCNFRTTVKPMTYIKKITNKNVSNNTGNKDAILYFLKDGVFSLLARRDGVMEVILKPFNTETFRKVEYDVLSNLD